MPPLLRVYLGAACQLYGDLTDIDVIKLHIRSGKVSLMGYDDFSKPIPYLVERVKIKMAEQEVDFFDYINAQTRPTKRLKRTTSQEVALCYQALKPHKKRRGISTLGAVTSTNSSIPRHNRACSRTAC